MKYKDTDSLEFLTLEEKVNPKEYADTLRASDLATRIKYIQPDFLMEYASLNLLEVGPLSLGNVGNRPHRHIPARVGAYFSM